MRYLYSLLFILALTSCSGTVDLNVSGDVDTGIVFNLTKSDAKRLGSSFNFYVMDNRTVPNGELKKIVWEIKEISNRGWFNFHKSYTNKWTYGIKPNGFKELVKPEPLQLNTEYYYSVSGGGYHGAGCFYLNDDKRVETTC